MISRIAVHLLKSSLINGNREATKVDNLSFNHRNLVNTDWFHTSAGNFPLIVAEL